MRGREETGKCAGERIGEREKRIGGDREMEGWMREGRRKKKIGEREKEE